MGDSEMTEPLELYDEDVFVANLEDPAEKYASITKKLPSGAPKVGLESMAEEPEEKPQEFCGSKFMWFAMCWCLIVIIVVVVVVMAVCPQCDSDDDGTPAPEPTLAPSVEMIPDNETMVPVTMIPTVTPPVVNDTSAPAGDPVTTEAPTTAPVATEAPTVGIVATETPTVGIVATETPTVGVVATETPTVGVVATETPTVGVVATETPTVVAGVETAAPTTSGPVDLFNALPEYSQAALLNPISPQSRAFLFVNYDPLVANRTEAELIQRFALATIYFGLGASSWTAGSVNPAGEECEWFADTGSLCNAEEQMQSLLLEQNGLEDGPIPPEIGLLTAIKDLDLSSNNIEGAIPTYLGQLTMLETLRLGSNQFTGTIPTELSGIATLTTLDLTGLDNVTGIIPPELCDTTTFDCRPEDLCGCDCACAAA